MSPNKHKLRAAGRKNVRASEKARELEVGIILEWKIKVREVEWDEEDCDFEYYDKSDGKPVHVDVDKEDAESSQKDSTLALFPNRSKEKEINNNGETAGGNGFISLSRSNWTFKPPERLGSVSCFWTWYNV